MLTTVTDSARISGILLRHGFKEVSALFGVAGHEIRGAEALSAGYTQAVLASTKNRPNRLRLALQELGPLFIRFGHFLATRPDLVSQEYAVELQTIQDQRPGLSNEQVDTLLESELGQPCPALFAHFEYQPVISTSFFVLHRARTHGGTDLLVKIQRPGLELLCDKDLDSLISIASPQQQKFLKDFEKIVREQLDYAQEREKLDRLAASLNTPNTWIPTSLPKLSSTRILSFEAPKNLVPVRKQYAALAIISLLDQLFELGWFQSLPTLTNTFVTDKKIGYFDCATFQELPAHLRLFTLKYLAGIFTRQSDEVVNSVRELYKNKKYDAVAFTKHLEGQLDPNSIRMLSFEDLHNRVTKSLARHSLQLPRQIGTVIAALYAAVQVSKHLDPSFNAHTRIEQYLRERLTQETRPKALFSTIRAFSRRNVNYVSRAPQFFGSTLQRISRVSPKTTQDQKQQKNTAQYDSSTGQTMTALLMAGLVVAGTFADRLSSPRIIGHNLYSLSLFILAGVLGLGLLRSIIRQGRR
jgi:ubiquinone biosynthesis protein